MKEERREIEEKDEKYVSESDVNESEMIENGNVEVEFTQAQEEEQNTHRCTEKIEESEEIKVGVEF